MQLRKCRWRVCSALVLFIFFSVAVAQDDEGGSQTGDAGSQNWAFRTGGAVTASPVLSEDGATLYVGSADHFFYALDTETGELKWRLKFPAGITASATIADGIIYVPCGNGALYAVVDNETEGVFHWFAPFRSQRRGISSPAVSEDGTIYVGSLDNRLYALFSDGARKWAFSAKDDVGTPVIGTEGTNESDTIYVSAGRNLFGVSIDGEQTSAFHPGGKIHSTPAIGEDGTIFFGSDNDIVYALEPGSGTNSIRWRVKTKNHVSSSPVIGVTGDIYIGAENARLYCFTTNGAVRWSVSTRKPVHAALSIGADGTIYAGSEDKQMYAISADGKIRWTFKTKGTIRSAAAIDGVGNIYFGSSDKNIYSVFDDTFANTDAFEDETVTNIWPMFRRDRLHSARSDHGEPYIIQTPVGIVGTNGQRSFDLAEGQSSLTLSNVGTDTVLVSVEARAGAPLNYQWRLNGEDIDPEDNPTANQPTLVLNNVQFSDAGNYSVEVSNDFGILDSDDFDNGEFVLTINSPPVFTVALSNQFLLVGGTLTLNAGASGTEPLFYQWKKDGVDIPGAQNATLIITNVQLTDAGQYSVMVMNIFGSTNSTPITVSVFPAPPAPLQPLAAGQRHSLAVLADHTLWAWGLDNFGQLGDARSGSTGAVGTTPPFGTIPELIGTNGAGSTNAVWQSVAAGSRGVDQLAGFSLGIQTNGTLWAWGLNTNGQLGIGSTTAPQVIPVRVGSESNWFQVAAGATHTLALQRDGTLWAWGGNDFGQLGLGSKGTNVSMPTRVGTESAWVEVGAGGFFSLARRADGTIWAWGANGDGQLGLGSKGSFKSVPTRIGTNSDWAGISAGIVHALALKTDGTIWTWGQNDFGQLGLGASGTFETNSPTQIGTSTDWRSVEAGSYHSFGIKTDGSLFAWGADWFGQLGDGTSGSQANTNGANRFSPFPIGTNHWLVVDASTHSLGMTVDGNIWAWGLNSHGQVGNGTTNNANLPVQLVFTNAVFTSTLTAPPAIIAPPMSLTNFVGTTASFFVNATGGPPLSYQWYFNSNAISGNSSASSATLTISNVQPSNAGFYFAVVMNPFGSVTSLTASLTVKDTNGITYLPGGGATTNGIAPTITMQPTNRTVLTNSSVSFSVSAVGTPALLYQWRFNSDPISSSNNATATNATFVILHAQPTNAGFYDVIVMNNYGAATSQLAELVVTNGNGATNRAPSITQQPIDQVANEGTDASFSVTAVGVPAVSYQWYFFSQIIGSTTNATAVQPTLVLTNVQGARDAGFYHVVVSNSLGTVTSVMASLTITNSSGLVFLPYQNGSAGVAISNSPPFVTLQPTNQMADPGSTVNFVVDAQGATPLSFQWRFNSNEIDIANNSSAGSTILTLPNVAATNVGFYDVVVSNNVGVTTSSVARLTLTGSGLAITPKQSVRVNEGAEIRIEPIHLSRDGVVIISSTQNGRRLVLEYKEALSDREWKPLGTNDAGGSVFFDPAPPLNRSRYYRVRTE